MPTRSRSSCILLPEYGREGVLAFAAALRAAFQQPLHVDGVSCEINAHVGIELAPEHGNDYRIPMRKADIALYEARELGVAVAVYDPLRDPHTPERLALSSELRGAIERGELLLYCHPKIDMRLNAHTNPVGELVSGK